jgi:hypothetical protein
MRAAKSGQTKKANHGNDENVTAPYIAALNDDAHARLSAAFCRIFRTTWPVKTAQHLALHGDIDERHAKRILAGQKITASVMIALFSSEYAQKFHWALMESFDGHEYWSELRKKLREENIKQQIEALQKELKQSQRGNA